MLITIFDITDNNEILILNPQSCKILRKKVNLDATYLYRKKLDRDNDQQLYS